MSTVYLVVPCYNEEQVLPETGKRLIAKMEELVSLGLADEKSRILLVNDGSKDKTWDLITELHQRNKYVCGLKLSRNRGHQNAVLAGLMTARQYCDCAISLDADLQDDIDVINQFLEKFSEGCDIVYGVRKKRDTDTFFKRSTAQGFYKILNALGVEVVYNHADYRLMSKRALDALSEYKEVNLFLRGIVPTIGFQTATVFYDRHERFAGESKYPLKKMLALAFDGVTSFSVKPIRMISVLGGTILGLSVLGLLGILIACLMGVAGLGRAAIVASLWLLGGIQLLCLGICGEYIGKIYSEVKARPKYFIDQFLQQ